VDESAVNISTSKLTNQLSGGDNLSGQAVMRSKIDDHSSGACKNAAYSAPITSTHIPIPLDASTITEQSFNSDTDAESERKLPSSLQVTGV
jgi:hypothetical protein